MKMLNKINKGLILTILVLLVLFIYLFTVEINRNKAKPEIEKTVKEYIELMNKYAVVPSDIQNLYAQISPEEIETKKKEFDTKITEHLNKYEGELKEKMIDNQKAIDMQKEVLEDFLKSENNMQSSIITKYKKELVKIRKYLFDDDQVTLTLETKTEVESKYLSNGEEKLQKNEVTSNDDTMTLKLVDGKWKVVYSAIEYYRTPMGNTMIMNGY